MSETAVKRSTRNRNSPMNRELSKSKSKTMSKDNLDIAGVMPPAE